MRRCIILALFIVALPAAAQDAIAPWKVDRRWVGPDMWANRLQDWRVQGGRLECVEGRPAKALRTVHYLGRRVTRTEGTLTMTVRTGLATGKRRLAEDAITGFLFGVGGSRDARAAAIVHASRGPGAGILAGVDGLGRAFIHLDQSTMPRSAAGPAGVLDRRGWSIHDADSIEPASPARHAIDGDRLSIWHSEWRLRKPTHPHHLAVDMGAATPISGIVYLPRQGDASGRTDRYRLYTSIDGESWGKPAATGRFPGGAAMQTVRFEARVARYFKFEAISAHRARPSTTVAELWALDAQAADVTPSTLPPGPPTDVELRLSVRSLAEGCVITLTTHAPDGRELDSATVSNVRPDRVLGNVALVSHPGHGPNAGRFWYRDWIIGGDRLGPLTPELVPGPVLATQYTVSRGTLNLTAQLTPLGSGDKGPVSLQTRQGNRWKTIARTAIRRASWTAKFTISSWPADQDVAYRVVLPLEIGDEEREFSWSGTVRGDPVTRKTETVVAAFTGNHNNGRGAERTPYDWSKDMWFPHTDITKAVAWHQPDLLFFSGDQIYEGQSPTGVDRRNLVLDYLYKWYLWCWAWRDLTRDIPAVTIPDDHDIYQGNLWGESGRKTTRDHFGGYVHPADFVRVVEATQTSHLPAPYDPTPVDQGIGVYYTDLVWGGIGFAILEDRKFKSGCGGGRLPPTGTNRPDHIRSQEFDVLDADVPGMKLLGDRQLKFLREWSGDWRGQEMKVALSQTVFAGMATHHGANLTYLRADLDSNGWPQSGRNRALKELQRGFAFHIAGDQHLGTVVHHGIEAHGDSIWSFCVPSVANFYPRAWAPECRDPYVRPATEAFVGNRKDGFGNRVTVFAATNPGASTGKKPAKLHDRMPGYGIVRLARDTRRITMECWPRHTHPSSADAKQYEGWPLTIGQQENYARAAKAYLPTLEIEGMEDAVVRVFDIATEKLVYAMRINGTSFRPFVFHQGRHRVEVGEPGTPRLQILELGPDATAKVKVVVPK